MIPVKRQEELQRLESGAVLKTVRLRTDAFDREDFARWVDAVPKSAQKRKLMECTLFSHAPLPKELELIYHQLMMPQTDFLETLNVPLGKMNAFYQREWYSYTDFGHLYIDFANAYYFGGGWRGSGNVQEETIFLEFFQLALLAYLSEASGKMIRPAEGSPEKQNADPTPFFVENAKRDFRIDPTLYGSALDAFSPDEIPRHVAPLENTHVSIAGIAARAWSYPGAYSRADLLYHLKAAYLAFLGEKYFHPQQARVHTGRWGSGVFNNSVKMLTAIQLLAARMAEVEIHFWGLDEYADLTSHISRFQTARESLRYFLIQQRIDSEWKPFAEQKKV